MIDTCLVEGTLELSEIKNSVTKVLKLDVKGHSLEKILCLRIKLHENCRGGMNHYHKPEWSKLSGKLYFLNMVCNKTINGTKQFIPSELLPLTHAKERRPLLKMQFVLRNSKSALHLGGGRVTTGLQSRIPWYINILLGAMKNIAPSKTVTFKELIRMWNSNKSVDI